MKKPKLPKKIQYNPIYQDVVDDFCAQIQEQELWRMFKEEKVGERIDYTIAGSSQYRVEKGVISCWVKKDHHWICNGDDIDTVGSLVHLNRKIINQNAIKNIFIRNASWVFTEVYHKHMVNWGVRWPKGRQENPLLYEYFNGNEQRQKDEETGQLESFLMGHFLRFNQKHAQAGWLSFTKKIWSHIDRELLSAVLLMNFRDSVTLTHYLKYQKYAENLKALLKIDKNLLPWSKNILPHLNEARHAIEQNQTFRNKERQEIWYSQVKTGQEKTLCWKELSGLPFSIASLVCHAAFKAEDARHFIQCWKMQPENIRTNTVWFLNTISNGYQGDGGQWNLLTTARKWWMPLIQILLYYASIERDEKGFNHVITRAWRYGWVMSIGEIKKHLEKEQPNFPQRLLSDQEMLNLIPIGNAIRVQFEKLWLTQTTVQTTPPVQFSRRL